MADSALAMNQSTYALISNGEGPAASTIKVWGKIGNLLALGLTPEVSANLEENGETRVLTRKGHRRSRWLGDWVGAGVASNQAISLLYPSRRGSALPGTPIKVVNMEQNTPSGARKTIQVQVQGDIGGFIQHLTDNPLDFDCKIIGKTGNPYQGIIPKAGGGGGGGAIV